MRKILGLLSLIPFGVFAQDMLTSRIYICTDQNGEVRLHNLNRANNCVERVIKVPQERSVRSVSTIAMMDPMPAPNALIVLKDTQFRRDRARMLILQTELTEANRDLQNLQGVYRQNPLTQTVASRLQLKTAQEKILSLRREIERE